MSSTRDQGRPVEKRHNQASPGMLPTWSIAPMSRKGTKPTQATTSAPPAESPAPSLGMFSSSPPGLFESPRTVHKSQQGYRSYLSQLASSPLEQRGPTTQNLTCAPRVLSPSPYSSPVRPMSALQLPSQPLIKLDQRTLKRSFSSISDPETYQRQIKLSISKSGRAEIAISPLQPAMGSEVSSDLMSRSREGLCIERAGSVATNATETATAISSSWDSDSDDDASDAGTDYGRYGPSEFVATNDAMTAFARTIARSRARTRHGGYSKTTSIVRTPMQPGTHQFFFEQTSRRSHLAPSPLTSMAESEVLRHAAAASASVMASDPASTPPGNVLLLDDVAFATGMTPYLPHSNS